MGDVLTYAASGLILSVALVHAPTPQYTLKGYLAAVYAAYLPTQLPIALGEMVLTGLALQYAFRQRPEVLEDLGVVDRRVPRPNLGLTAAFSGLLHRGPPRRERPRPGRPEESGGRQAPRDAASTAAAEAETKSGFTGMDEAVNEKMSEDAGLKVHEPYINLEGQGDVWNLTLLAAAAIAGFILGRWWHLLFGGRIGRPDTVSGEPGTTS